MLKVNSTHVTVDASGKYCCELIYDNNSKGAGLHDVLISTLTIRWDGKLNNTFAFI